MLPLEEVRCRARSGASFRSRSASDTTPTIDAVAISDRKGAHPVLAHHPNQLLERGRPRHRHDGPRHHLANGAHRRHLLVRGCGAVRPRSPPYGGTVGRRSLEGGGPAPPEASARAGVDRALARLRAAATLRYVSRPPTVRSPTPSANAAADRGGARARLGARPRRRARAHRGARGRHHRRVATGRSASSARTRPHRATSSRRGSTRRARRDRAAIPSATASSAC